MSLKRIQCIPNADGITLSLGRKSLKGYGNAIVVQTAQAFIESVMEII